MRHAQHETFDFPPAVDGAGRPTEEVALELTIQMTDEGNVDIGLAANARRVYDLD